MKNGKNNTQLNASVETKCAEIYEMSNETNKRIFV